MNWKDFFDSLGLNGTWWQWRILKMEERFKGFFTVARDNRNRVTYEHKFCPHCGALVDRNDDVCMRCGGKVGSWRAQAARRTLGLILPSWCPVASLLIFSNLVALGIALVLYGPAHLLNPTSSALINLGALVPSRFLEYQEYWRIITYGYLHIGLMHILFNLLALSQVGMVLEQEIGKARLFTLYTLSIIGGGAADVLVRGSVPVVIAGASGALFGLVGFGITYYHFRSGAFGRPQRNFFLHWAVYGFVFGFMIGADNICHFGGLVVGAVLGFLVERERLYRDRLNPVWNVLSVVCLLATIGAYVWMLFFR